MTNYASIERIALAETLRSVGPDAPTLCEGWTTRDLALHLIERDSRPDIIAGKALESVPLWNAAAQKAHAKLADEPWGVLVHKVANPGLSPARLEALDKRINTAEFFIHHEDILRAQPDFERRELDQDHEAQLWSGLRTMAKMLLRSEDGTVVLAAHGFGSVAGGRGADTTVEVVQGAPSELFLWAFGRDDHADVQIHAVTD